MCVEEGLRPNESSSWERICRGRGVSPEEARTGANALGQEQTLQVPRPGLPGQVGREGSHLQRPRESCEPKKQLQSQHQGCGLCSTTWSWPEPRGRHSGPPRGILHGRHRLRRGPWTRWSWQSQEVFVASPDEAVTNGLSRPGGHKAGSARQMFMMMRESRRVEAPEPVPLHPRQAGPARRGCSGKTAGLALGQSTERPPVCVPLTAQPCSVVVVNSTEKSSFFP